MRMSKHWRRCVCSHVYRHVPGICADMRVQMKNEPAKTCVKTCVKKYGWTCALMCAQTCVTYIMVMRLDMDDMQV